MGTDFVTRGVLVMVKPTLERVVGMTDLEQEIEAELRNGPPVREPRPVNFAPPRVRAPALSMPDYVEHREGATEIGKLSAEAVVREYEAAAKDIEAMGAELIDLVKQSKAMTRDAIAVTAWRKETSALS